MWQTDLRGPQVSWDRSQEAVAQIWAEGGDAMRQPVPPPGMPRGTPPADGALAVAAIVQGPTIRFGASRPHADRGPCTNCHTVVTGGGNPLPMISSSSQMPHAFRGVCGNCHRVSLSNAPMGNPVAGPVTAVPGVPGTQPAPINAPTITPAPINEAEWRGLEVRPGTQGVTVGAADGAAALAGVQPQDVVVSINGAPIATMADFVAMTNNGALPRGTAIVRRGGQRLAFELAGVRAGVPAGAPAQGLAGNPPSLPPGAAPATAGSWGSTAPGATF